MSEQLTIIATFRAKPGQSEELGRRLIALVEPTRAEAGCINYDLHRSSEDRDIWMFYENWRSKADLDAHVETPYLQALIRDLPKLTVDGLKLKYYSMSSTPRT
jgi:quinol monooxygenase YgiN